MHALLRQISIATVLCAFLACSSKPEPVHDKLGPRSNAAAIAQDLSRAESFVATGAVDAARPIFDRALATSDLQDDLAVRGYLGRADCKLATGDSAGAFADAQQASLRSKSLRRHDKKAADGLTANLDRVYGDCALATSDPAAARTRYERVLKAAGATKAADLDGLRYRLYLAATLALDFDSADLLRAVENPNRPDLVALAARYNVVRPQAGGGAASPPAPATLSLGAITVLTRAKWSARAPDPKKLDPMTKIFRITVHHTAELTTETDERSVEAELRAIQSGHQHGEGYADIGYHFLIDPTGRVWQGRELKYQGAHAGNAALNAGNIGVCLLGNFEEQSLPARQGTALITLLEQLRGKYGIRREYVYGHGEIRKMGGIGGTECPGQRVQSLVDRYRRGGATP